MYLSDVRITGGNGEVGTQLLSICSNGDWKCSLVNDVSDIRKDNVVVHLACRHPNDSVKHQVDSNLHYLSQVIDVCQSVNARIIFFSSTSIYGQNVKGTVYETDYPSVQNTYGMTKWLGEQLIIESQVDYVIMRCPAILELHNVRNLLSRIYLKLANHESISLFNADMQFNNFIDVQTLYQFIDLVIKRSEKRNLIVNCAVRPKLSLRQIVMVMRECMNSSSDVGTVKSHQNGVIVSAEPFWDILGDRLECPSKIIAKWVRQRLNVSTTTVTQGLGFAQ